MRFTITIPGSLPLDVGYYEINPFPGCNQICVFNHVHIYPEYRGKHYDTLAHAQRLKKAKDLGYDMVICTMLDTNRVEEHILNHHRWKYAATFHNRETGHDIQIRCKNLASSYEEELYGETNLTHSYKEEYQ